MLPFLNLLLRPRAFITFSSNPVSVPTSGSSTCLDRRAFSSSSPFPKSGPISACSSSNGTHAPWTLNCHVFEVQGVGRMITKGRSEGAHLHTLGSPAYQHRPIQNPLDAGLNPKSAALPHRHPLSELESPCFSLTIFSCPDQCPLASPRRYSSRPAILFLHHLTDNQTHRCRLKRPAHPRRALGEERWVQYAPSGKRRKPVLTFVRECKEERGEPRGLCNVGDVGYNCDSGDGDDDWARMWERARRQERRDPR